VAPRCRTTPSTRFEVADGPEQPVVALVKHLVVHDGAVGCWSLARQQHDCVLALVEVANQNLSEQLLPPGGMVPGADLNVGTKAPVSAGARRGERRLGRSDPGSKCLQAAPIPVL